MSLVAWAYAKFDALLLTATPAILLPPNRSTMNSMTLSPFLYDLV